ncbi:MAG: hypothetical protein AAFX06_27245 [Planctomycetota bacterium]
MRRTNLLRQFLLLSFAVFGASVLADELSEEERSSIWERFVQEDVNEDGKVSKEEMFRAVLIRAGLGRRVDQRQAALQVHWTFQRLDADENGTVTLAEIHDDVLATKAHLKSIAAEDRRLYEGRFSQCSYNALASTLIHFHGSTPEFKERERELMEKTRFVDPLEGSGMGAFFGWVPWTSYMVNSKAIDWNEGVVDLVAENFSCRAKQLPTVDAEKREITVRYADGERETLKRTMLDQLKRGPVMIWTPYAAVLSPVPKRWRHVTRIDDQTDVVVYGPFTHAVACFLKDDGRIAVCDGAVPDGVFYTDVETLVATSCAMPAFIRIRPPEGGTTIHARCRGVGDEQYNVVVAPVKGRSD